MGRQLIFLSWAFPPMRYPRAFQVGRLVRALDNQVGIDVVCADKESNEEGFDGLLMRTNIHRRKTPVWELLHRVVSRLTGGKLTHVPDPQICWSLSAARYVSKELTPDKNQFLVTFGQPMSVHLAGLILKRRYGVKWIAHFSDPWSENPFVKQGKLLRSLNRFLERKVISYCDRAVFTSEETVDLVFRNYPVSLREKAVVVPHSFDPEEFLGKRGSGQCFNEDGGSRDLVIRSIGNFYGTRSPEPFIRALESLLETDPSQLNDVRVEFVGDVENWSEREIDPRLLGLVSCTGYVAPDKAVELTCKSDLLLLVDSKSDLSVFLPSKLIDYIAASRPIMAVTPPGTAAKLVKRYGGWISNPASHEETAEVLSQALSYIRENGSEGFGSSKVREEFSAARVSQKFLSLIEE